MYQPKIRNDLIRRLYQLAKSQGIPMTRLVNALLEQGITRVEHGLVEMSDPPAPLYVNTEGEHA